MPGRLVTITCVVLLAGCSRNQPPEILAVKAFPEVIAPGGSVDLIVSAQDPENRPMRFRWSARDGDFSATNDSITKWVAPNKRGTYKITAAVTDNRGARTSKSIEIKVEKEASGSVFSGSLSDESEVKRTSRLRSRTRSTGTTSSQDEESGRRRPRRARPARRQK